MGSHWKQLTANGSPEIFTQAWIYQKNYRHNRFPSSTGCHDMQFFSPVLRWRNVTVQLLLLIMNVFILLIKIIPFLILVSPRANRQINIKTKIYNTKITLQFFCTEVIARFWSDTACIHFGGMNLHPQPQRTVTEGNDSICLPAMPPHFY